MLSPAGRYEMSGELDPGGGYRVCADIERAPGGYLRGHTLWLKGSEGVFDTLTAPLPTRHPAPAMRAGCPRAGWFDDHPPTLPLYREKGIGVSPVGEPGGEDLLHAALLALTQMRDAAVKASEQRCGGKTCFEVLLDFGRFDRSAPGRDEDLWTLRPLLRHLGRRQVEVRVNSQGLLDRFRFTPRFSSSASVTSAAAVTIRLEGFGDAPALPRAPAPAAIE
jgi:hypothetical protein